MPLTIPTEKQAREQFLETLRNLISEAQANFDEYYSHRDVDRQSYWKTRRDALLEVRQLWLETIGG